MKLGIICPHESLRFISEHTDFDVALGFMATRYAEYLRAMQEQLFLKRDIILMQMPGHPVRDDYYITAARRLSPIYMASTPQLSAEESYRNYIACNMALGRYKETEDITVFPYITAMDDEENLALYAETTQRRFIDCFIADDLPLRFVHPGIIVGMSPVEMLQKKKPYALITSYPIICALRGRGIFDADGELFITWPFDTDTDWFLRPLNSKQLSLAVENIKELRNAIVQR